MLQQVLEFAGIDSHACASLLGISPPIFHEWVTGQRPIPESQIPALSTVIGIEPQLLLSTKTKKAVPGELMPAIWFKFRGEKLNYADRECAILIRQLAYYLNELEDITASRSTGWRSTFENIQGNVDHQSPPREQGRQAARLFRQERGLSHGVAGIGDALRMYLRVLGILVVESSVRDSSIEGCSFYVGQRPIDRPCIFANTYGSNWYRRNGILGHELAHAIFDAQGEGASIDLIVEDSISAPQMSDIKEQRAQAFSQELLVPREVLRHVGATSGLKWHALTAQDLARLVAATGAEQKMVICAASDAEFITAEEAEAYAKMVIQDELKAIDKHALTTAEFFELIGAEEARPFAGKRTTTIPSRKLTLPVGYISRVLEAVLDEAITPSRAAEMLMIDEDTFIERFPAVWKASEEALVA